MVEEAKPTVAKEPFKQCGFGKVFPRFFFSHFSGAV
jgi:hypothetical protein